MRNFLRLTTCLMLFLLTNFLCLAQKIPYNYLPDISYNQSVPTPEEVLGYPVGKWHVRHDQVVQYFRALAEASPRVRLVETGRTYEQRPLLLAIITSADNQSRLNEIQENHLKLTDPEQAQQLNIDDMPVVVYQGYSIHGNEPSGTNASLLYAYHLAAAQTDEVQQQLKQAIVLLDPSLNPDGLSRFAQWANSYKSKRPVADRWSREHNEAWPGGRTNHYWFDLNRDWLLLQHPESRARINQFHQWKPNVLTDHHEMGTNATYFFQPGIPSRNNPLTPSQNTRLTERMAEFFASSLDEIGSLYYTQESFDDFYYGKGSTYPDVNGGVGILFEQASSRGHLQESEHGELSFPFTIKNQLTTSMATLKGAVEIKKNLLSYQRDFFANSSRQGRKDDFGGYIFGDSYDRNRLNKFVELLRAHQIEVYKVSEDYETESSDFEAGHSFAVPFEQSQYRLIKAMFEKVTEFEDSLFYDVSGWTLPLAFNVNYQKLTDREFRRLELGAKIEDTQRVAGQVFGGKSEYAYVFAWDELLAPLAAYHLLEEELRAFVTSKSFKVELERGRQSFEPGTIILPVTNQKKSSNYIYKKLQEISLETGVDFYAVNSGLTPEGVDLGSRSLNKLGKPKPLLFIGDGVSSYESGAIWHMMDQRYKMGVTLGDLSYINSIDLKEYNVIIMPEGNYRSLRSSSSKKIKQWVREGGTLVALRGAIDWLDRNNMIDLEAISVEDTTKHQATDLPKSYASLQNERGAQYIGGAVFEVRIDPSHPLFYGYRQNKLAVFKRGTEFFKPTENPYATPALYSKEALISGYISKEKAALLGNSAAVTVHRNGSGRIICISDNPNFRAFWLGTNKLLLNAIYFGEHIQSGAAQKPPKSE